MAELRMTAILQEQLPRALQAIDFPEFLTLAACQEWQHSTAGLHRADLIAPLMQGQRYNSFFGPSKDKTTIVSHLRGERVLRSF